MPAITVPSALSPSSKVTVVPGAVVPSIVGLLILVKAISVVINGAAGAAVSISIGNPTDSADTLPARSVALTVSV